ncbi:TPA: glycosyltransferase family 8 protein, partial [Campylobacter jejuni]|nr:glycosyltransferase family 8 protein [Campylobacter jejuni]HDZ5091129.1 glycosyltransferase family 8 protein [Campylobacter jejuni]HDZ5092781.1 glycosyltransferase family 8 protein [Campylobacter jejuni]HDZ5101190.1 glycosyltransferase family 8 protein [Campylobacter jejuni]HDZ5107726.1 glycosyltransferase family 8 protein [Campylobacter jejuni]
MYHIVFNADDNYIKYMVVLITSIIKNANSQSNATNILHLEQKNQKEKFVFHVLTDFISTDNMRKTIEFCKELDKIYPCEINFYKIDQNIFENENLSRYRGNYSTYYRLKLGSYLPKKIKKCIYLDIDILVLSDIRELFNFDLQGKILGASFILHPWVEPLKPLNSKDDFFELKSTYFNSGVLLIDLEKWREEEIEKKCLQFMKKYYIRNPPDEVILNAIFGVDITNLPLSWNFLLGFLFNSATFFNESNQIKACFSKHYLNHHAKCIKILHYTLNI